MEEKSLFIGLDIGNVESRICYYDESKYEPVCINDKTIPTILGVKDTGEWLYGEEALEMHNAGRCDIIENGINAIAAGEPLMLNEREVKPVFYLATFLRKILSLIHGAEPGKRIRKLVVTAISVTKNLTDILYVALDSIGIGRDRVCVLNYRQSYLYFVMSQGREFWLNDVGMFDFGHEGLVYLQITMDRRKKPYIVGIKEKDYSEDLNMSMLDEYSEEKLVYEFNNITQNALHKQILSTLYMIGPGFASGWADESMKKLCSGRRVFKGVNLYAEGACYAARHLAGEGNIEPFVYIDENMIASHISTMVYVNASYQEIIIARAGSVWYDIDNSFDIIPDDEMEIGIKVSNVITRESSKHIIEFNDIVSRRPSRMSRITVRVRMQDIEHVVITVKDDGFGEMYPSSNRIFERIIRI